MKLNQWILAQPGVDQLMPPWSKCRAVPELPEAWQKGTGIKVLGSSLPPDPIPEEYTVIGGIWSLFSGDSEMIRKNPKLSWVSSTSEFEQWMLRWHPRLDQIHDTVGVPPKNAQAVVYVCEDDLFGRRTAVQTGLDALELTSIFRSVHQTQGHSVLVKWLRQNGYKGPVDVVYSSELTQEIEVALRIWQRQGNFRIPERDKDMATVKLMYTHLWLDVLGIKKGIVYEPASHMWLEDHLSYLRPWFRQQTPEQIGFIGYLPFWSSAGETRYKHFGEVPSNGTWRGHPYAFEEPEAVWYAVNMLFNQRRIRTHPTALTVEEIRQQVAWDLETYYK